MASLQDIYSDVTSLVNALCQERDQRQQNLNDFHGNITVTKVDSLVRLEAIQKKIRYLIEKGYGSGGIGDGGSNGIRVTSTPPQVRKLQQQHHQQHHQHQHQHQQRPRNNSNEEYRLERQENICAVDLSQHEFKRSRTESAMALESVVANILLADTKKSSKSNKPSKLSKVTTKMDPTTISSLNPSLRRLGAIARRSSLLHAATEQQGDTSNKVILEN